MMTAKTKKIISLSVFLGVNIACFVLCFFLMDALPKYVQIISLILFAVSGTFGAVTAFKTPDLLYKIAMLVSYLAAAIFVGYVILDKTGVLATINSQEALKAFIQSARPWDMIIFVLITIFEVVVLPIPAAVTVVLGVVIYDPLTSFLLSTLGTYIGSVIAFFLGRIFGRKLAVWLVGEENTDKYSKILAEKGKAAFILMMLLPGFPDDIICILAGLTAMKFRFFFLIVALTRPLMIAAYAYSFAIPFSGWGIPVWIGIAAFAVLVAILIIRFKNKILGIKEVKKDGKKENGDDNEKTL